MTTFTTQDKEEAYKQMLEEAPAHMGYEDAVPQNVEIIVEPIPFMGMVAIQDKEDRATYYQEQTQILQAEIQRLRKKLRDLGEND